MSQINVPDNLPDFEKYFENNLLRLNTLLDELLSKAPVQFLHEKLKEIENTSSIETFEHINHLYKP